MWEGVKLFLSWVRDSLVPIFDLFRDERVAIGLSLLLLVIAAASALWFWLHHIAPWLRSLKRAEARVAEAADAGVFLDRFADIDAAIAGDERLAHGWSEFKESLIIPEGGGARRLIRNTARPQLYLNVPSAVEAGLPLPSYLALPNVFVGLGLLFTFIGLVAALHFAAEGVTSADVAEAQQSLQSLLKAATFKFMTSITGVFISLALSTIFRRLVRTLQMRFEGLCTALEKRLDYVSAASLADEQLRELSSQTLALERFNTDFAVELAQVLDDRLNRTLTASLSQAVQPVVQAVEGLSGNMGSMNQGAIESMIRDFQTGLKQSTGDELGSVVSALGQVRETLERASAGLQANGADFGSRLGRVAEQIEQRLDSATRGMSEGLAGTMTEIMGSVAAALGQVQETLERTSTGLQANGADFGSRLDRVAEQIEQRLEGATRSMSDGLAGTMTEIKGLLQDLGTGMHDDARRASEGMAEANQRTLNALNEAGLAFSAELRQTGADFAKTLSGSLEVLSQFERTLNALDGRFARQVEAFDGSTNRLQDLAAQLEQSNRSLKDAAAPIASTANTFSMAAQRVEAAGGALHATGGRIAELNTQLKDTFEANRRVWDEYRARFAQVDEHLEGVVKLLTDGTRAYHREIAGFVANLDSQLAKAVNSFSGAVSELGEVAEGLEEHMRGANGGSGPRPGAGPRPGRPS